MTVDRVLLPRTISCGPVSTRAALVRRPSRTSTITDAALMAMSTGQGIDQRPPWRRDGGKPEIPETAKGHLPGQARFGHAPWAARQAGSSRRTAGHRNCGNGPVIPTASDVDRFGGVARGNRAQGGNVAGEDVPGFATSGDDLLVGLEDGDGGAAGAEVGPDVPDRVQLRGLWRERHQGDGAGHLQGLRAMPSGAVQHGNGVRPRRWCGKSRRSRAFMAAVPAPGMTSAVVALRSGQTVPDMQAQVRCTGYRGARPGDCRAGPGCG